MPWFPHTVTLEKLEYDAAVNIHGAGLPQYQLTLAVTFASVSDAWVVTLNEI